MIPEGLVVVRPPRAEARRRLLIGPANSGGQAFAWAHAAERFIPDVAGTSYRCLEDPNGFDIHLINTSALTFDSGFSRRLHAHIVDSFTHAILESNWPMVQGNGETPRRGVAMLRNAGVHVALVAHGSDVRIPSQHAAQQRWHQYQNMDPEAVERLERKATAAVKHYNSFGGEVYVSTVGLLDFLPNATWLPLVLDASQWQVDRAALDSDDVTVMFAPSSAQKGQEWIDPVLTDLDVAGQVNYVRLQRVPHDQMPAALGAVDVVVDQMGADDYGVAAVEAMAAGRLVVGMVSDRVRQHIRDATGLDVPIVQADPSTVREVIGDIAARPSVYADIAARGPAFVTAVHDGRLAAAALAPFLDRPVRTLPDVPARSLQPRTATLDVANGPRPHVLYVAWGFPPSRGGGVYRALATANLLRRVGFDVTVLTAQREAFIRYTGMDESLEALVDPAITIERTPFDWPILEHDLTRWPKERAKDPAGWRDAQRLRDRIDFPEQSYGPWKAELLRAADCIMARRRVDLVIGTANPNVDFVVGHHLAEQHGVPYVMDYRDAWRLDVFSGEELQHEDPRVKELESTYVDGAQEVWFVNDPIRHWHEREYPASADRMHTVMNGYDEQFVPAPRVISPPPDAPLRFGYIGTISSKVPIAEFVAGWQLARETNDVLGRSSADLWGYLGFYSTEDPHLRQLVQQAGEHDVFFRGAIDKGKVSAAYEAMDVLLLILGAGVYVTSGKVFEYMASALPIVSVHDPRNAASSVLDGYPLWFPAADLSPASIGEALGRTAAAAPAVDDLVRADCVDFSLQFERERQLLPRLEQLITTTPAGVER